MGMGGKDEHGRPIDPQAMLEMMPGYKFARDQGLRTVQNAFGPRGLSLSGAALRGGAEYATGLADQTFGGQFNRLMDIAKTGSNAATMTGQFGAQASQTGGNFLVDRGNAMAAGTMGNANALTGGLNNASQLMMLQKLLGGFGGTGAGGGGGGGDLYGYGTDFAPGWGTDAAGNDLFTDEGGFTLNLPGSTLK